MNTTPFTFSIKEAFRQSWELFKKNIQFFLVLALISILLGLGGNEQKNMPEILSAALALASYLWSILWKKTAIAFARGHEQTLSLSSLKALFPTIREVGTLIALSIISYAVLAIGGLFVAASMIGIVFGGFSTPLLVAGLIILLPGLYIAFRLVFAIYVYLEKSTSIRESLKQSWRMTTASSVWTIVGVMLIVGLLYVVGAAPYGIGLLVTYPVGALLMAKLYTALSDHYNQAHIDTTTPPVSEPEA